MARNAGTGELGVAVQSHWFSVGGLVPWARAGVGAVASQGAVDPSYGPCGLELLERGATAEEALAQLVAADSGADGRQVAIVDARGGLATHTGADCIPNAGFVHGDGVSCQANLVAGESVWDAMLEAFDAQADAPLAVRMLAALEAGELAGGDVRGRQSAAMLIVPAVGEAWETSLSLRVEDHAEPLRELRRLVGLHEAYAVAEQADEAGANGLYDQAAALYRRASAMAPSNSELRFWAAMGVAQAGDPDGAVKELRALIATEPSWHTLLTRLPIGMVPAASVVLERLEAYGGPPSGALGPQRVVKTGGEAANGRATRIDEVARAAGVSITTVSHVYSGRRPVKAKTRARVLEAAERLRYRRQPSAVALATGRTMTIALHLSMGGAELIFNPFYSALFPSLSLGAVKHGYSLLFFPENDVPAADALITDNKFDGAIVLDPRRGDSFVGRLIEAGKPYVSLGRALDGPYAPRVDIDQREMFESVLRHLHEEGYRRPAMIATRAEMSAIVDLHSSFAALVPSGQTAQADNVFDSAAQRAVTELFYSAEPPDAIICSNDQLAVGVLRAAERLGCRVPEDLGVVGISDILAPYSDPPLTSVREFPDVIGARLIETIAALLTDPSSDPGVSIIPTKLITRRSTARTSA